MPSIGIDADRSMNRSSSSRCGAAATAARASPTSWTRCARHCRGFLVDKMRRGPGRLDPDDRRQLLVVDPDPPAGVLGDIPVRGDDHHDRLADVLHVGGASG